METANAALEPGGLVVDGHHNLDVGPTGRGDAVAAGSRDVGEIKHGPSIGSAPQSALGST